VRLGQLVVSILLLLVAPFGDRVITKDRVIGWIVAVASALLLNVAVELWLLAYSFRQTREGFSRTVDEVEKRFEAQMSRRIPHLEIDESMIQYVALAKHLLGPQSGLASIMHEWILDKAAEIIRSGKYLQHFGDEDEPADKVFEEARVRVLSRVLRKARKRVVACTMVDAEHLRLFWSNDAKREYIAAHREVLLRQDPIPIRRVLIIPSNLPHEAKTQLIDVVTDFLNFGMTQNYWIPESEARSAFAGQPVPFPTRGFFLADDNLSGADAELAFLSEGVWLQEGSDRVTGEGFGTGLGNKRYERRPYFMFTKDLEKAKLVRQASRQFDLLLEHSKERKLDSDEAVDHLKVYLGIRATAQKR
jgi:hypothetical protein